MNKQQTSHDCEANTKRAKRPALTLDKRTIRTLSGSELQLIAGGDPCVCTCWCNHSAVITVAPPK